MTEIARGDEALAGLRGRPARAAAGNRVRKRHAAERRFRLLGLGALLAALALLAFLLVSVMSQGFTAFVQTNVRLDIAFARDVLDPDATGERDVLARANYAELLNASLQDLFPDVEGRREERALRSLMSTGAALELRDMVLENPALIGTTQSVWLLADDEVDQFVKGRIDPDLPEADRPIKDMEIAWLNRLDEQGRLDLQFNTRFFTSGDSREPELAGIWGAVVGSFYMMLVTLALATPLGVAAATYLEEFAPKDRRWVDVVEVNINNLAAVPSIVFGLLGLAVFLNVMHLPRSAPLVGGLTLTIMTLPVIVVVTRAALRAVPPSIREAAYGVGASRVQVVAHHVLPVALPGILTGVIIGMARALGETAPLLMIGMVAFIVDVPDGPLDPATALPVQVFIWADSPERAFTEKTAGAIIVLIAFLVAMNALAVLLRKRFERRW